jgi:hypothetical protein
VTAIPRRAFLSAAGLAYAGCRRREPVERQEVVEAAQRLVTQRLASPGSAAFGGEADTSVEELGGSRYRVRGMVDYEGEIGARRVMFNCVLRRRDKEWELEDLVLE